MRNALQEALNTAGLVGRMTGRVNAKGLAQVPSYGSRLGWLIASFEGGNKPVLYDVDHVVGDYCLLDTTGRDFGSDSFLFWERNSRLLGWCRPIWERYIHEDNRWTDRARYCSFSMSAMQSEAKLAYRRPKMDVLYLVASIDERKREEARTQAKLDMYSMGLRKSDKWFWCMLDTYTDHHEKLNDSDRLVERKVRKEKVDKYRSKMVGKRLELISTLHEGRALRL